MIKSNKKALYFLTGLAIFFGFLLIVLFHTIEMNHIQKSAIAILNKMVDKDYITKDILPDAYVIYTQEDYSDILPDSEEEMLTYYINNKSEIPFGEVQRFNSDNDYIYFVALNKDYMEEDGYSSAKGTPIIYVNVSFESDLVKTTTIILMIAMIIIAVLLYFAGNQIAKILDDKEASMKCFFENASHELKTPLMAIRSYADGIISGLVNQERGYEIIIKETERMTSLVGDILELSKVDSGIAIPNLEKNDVREILYDAILLIEPILKQKGLEITMNIPKALIAECDEDMMFSAVSNILINSIRYSKSYIKIEGFRKRDMIIIRILDDGQDFSQVDVNHTFDRFYKGVKGQSGIGMALAREYIKIHNGDILIKFNDGTIFEILLPITCKKTTD